MHGDGDVLCGGAAGACGRDYVGGGGCGGYFCPARGIHRADARGDAKRFSAADAPEKLGDLTGVDVLGPGLERDLGGMLDRDQDLVRIHAALAGGQQGIQGGGPGR